MATLQVKNFDDKLYRALRRRAKRNDRSISQEVTNLVRTCLEAPPQGAGRPFQRLLELEGSWQDGRTTEEILADVRRGRDERPRFEKELRDALG